jgi:hypothetical protein
MSGSEPPPLPNVWSFTGAMPRIAEAEVEASVGDQLRRRVSGIFLLVMAVTFASSGSARSGVQRALANSRRPCGMPAGQPALYVLDLTFLIPRSAVTGRPGRAAATA